MRGDRVLKEVRKDVLGVTRQVVRGGPERGLAALASRGLGRHREEVVEGVGIKGRESRLGGIVQQNLSKEGCDDIAHVCIPARASYQA